MVDPLKQIKPDTSVVAQHQENHPSWAAAANEGIVLEDVTLADHTQPPFISGFVDETGQELTLERRQQIMASRKLPEDGDMRHATFGALGKREPYGASAVRLRPKRILLNPARPFDAEAVADKRAEQEAAVAVEKQFSNTKEKS